MDGLQVDGDVIIQKTTGDVSLTIQANENSGAREPQLNLKGYNTGSNPIINFGDNVGYAGFIEYENSDNSMRIGTNTSERMRIDSSGNVGIGKSSYGSISTDGFWWESASNYLALSANGTSPIYMNRNGSDGGLINFYKSGSTVGSIGTASGFLYAGHDDVGLIFRSNESIRPYNPSTTSERDAQIDLGVGAVRFKDLYLSGGVYLGGTGSANKLDDVETGTFTPSYSTSGGSFSHDGATAGIYTKIGNVVSKF